MIYDGPGTFLILCEECSMRKEFDKPCANCAREKRVTRLTFLGCSAVAILAVIYAGGLFS
jgi:hypothetical protein